MAGNLREESIAVMKVLSSRVDKLPSEADFKLAEIDRLYFVRKANGFAGRMISSESAFCNVAENDTTTLSEVFRLIAAARLLCCKGCVNLIAIVGCELML